MVFPRPGGPCLCGHSSSSSSRCHPSVAWGFLAGSRLFEGSAAPAAAAAASSQHRETYSKLFLGDFRKDVPAPKRLFRTPFVLQGHGVSPSRRAVSLCLIAAAQQQHHSSSSSHQQQHQQQAAAGSSSRQQQAAGSRRQQQAAAGSSRHQ